MEMGVQVSSLKPLLKTRKEVAQAFRTIAQMGWKTVQLQWIDEGVSPEAIGEELQRSGLSSVSVQDFYEIIRENPGYYIRLNQVTGGTWLCVSRIPERLKTREGLDVFIRELRQIQMDLDSLGQRLCLHPVSADFTAVPGMDAVAYILDNMPELDICFDLYHLGKNTSDMPAYIRRYGSRVRMVHFKDSRGGRLVPAGQGDTDYTGVVQACLEAGVLYGFVEQETWDGDPYLFLKEADHWVQAQLP